MGSILAELGGRPFAVLCAAMFLFYLSFQLLLPVVPLYAASLGGREADVGLIIGVFAFASMVCRPVAGRLADRIGRQPLVLVGAAIFAAASFSYAVVAAIAPLLLLRLAHGVGMGLGPTAATVMVTDLASPERRGAAMGWLGVTTTAGLAVGPYLGALLTRRFGFAVTFGAAGLIALGAVGLAWALPETRAPLDATRRPRARLEAGPRSPWLFSPGAAYPSLLLLTLYFSYGGLVSFLPLFTDHHRLGNPGLFFAALALTVVAVRARAGHLADRIGRRLVVAPSLVLAGAALVILARARSPAGVVASAVVYGIGFGAAQPALMAMTADRVAPEERGRAMGTFYTAWELGISSGSILLGLCAARLGYPVMWAVGGLVAWIGAAAATRQLTRLRG